MQKILHSPCWCRNVCGADKVLLELIKGFKMLWGTRAITQWWCLALVSVLRLKSSTIHGAGNILTQKGFLYFCSYKPIPKQIAKYAVDKENGITTFTTIQTAVLEGIYLKRKLKLPLDLACMKLVCRPKAISDFDQLFDGALWLIRLWQFLNASQPRQQFAMWKICCSSHL